jgi:hypothetical protein
VIDATSGKPVGGAFVVLGVGAPMGVLASGTQMLPRPQDRIGVAIANAQGRFVFRDVPAGDHSIVSTLDGYLAGASGRRRPGGPGRTFSVADGARVLDANVTLWRFATTSGIVRDDRGDPVVGVAVQAMSRQVIGGRLELSYTGGGGSTTDDRGYYRVPSLVPGSYVVLVQASTRTVPVSLSDAYRAAVTSGTAGTISRSWTETGALQISSGGLVVDDWQVSVSSAQPNPLPGPNGTLLVHPTTFHGDVTSLSQTKAIALKAGEDRSGVDLRLPLVTGVRISGVLQGPDGPASGYGMRLIPAASGDAFNEIPVAYCTTDGAGRFAFLGVPSGAYLIRAYRVVVPGLVRPIPAPAGAGAIPGSRVEVAPAPVGPTPPSLFAETAVSAGSAHVDGLAITLQPGAIMTGRVAFEGATPPPAATQLERLQLQIRPLNGTGPAVAVKVDAEGRLTSSGMAPGRYTISPGALPGIVWSLASARIGGVDAAQQVFNVSSADINDVAITFTDKVISLKGTVTPGQGGGDADAMVVVFPADVQNWMATGMSPRRIATAPTTGTGAYDIRVQVAGDYMVVAIPTDVAPDVDAEFAKRFAASAVRVSLALGDAKTLPLTISRAR